MERYPASPLEMGGPPLLLSQAVPRHPTPNTEPDILEVPFPPFKSVGTEQELTDFLSRKMLAPSPPSALLEEPLFSFLIFALNSTIGDFSGIIIPPPMPRD